MSTDNSASQVKKAAVGKSNATVTLAVLAIWLGLSFLGQMLFIDQNERLDAGAIFVAGAGPILLVSALVLIFRGAALPGAAVRAVLGFICAGVAVGELTDASKGVLWAVVGVAVLAVAVAAVLRTKLRHS